MDRQSARIRVDGHDHAIVECIEAFLFQQCKQTTTPADIVSQHFANVGDFFLVFRFDWKFYSRYLKSIFRSVDNVLTAIDRGSSDMNIKVWRPFATNVIVHVSDGFENYFIILHFWQRIFSIQSFADNTGPCPESGTYFQRDHDRVGHC